MPTNEKKGVTVKIDAELHAEVKQYIEAHEMTMADFVTLALQDELHPRLNIKEDKDMGNMRTLAFQVPEELFQKIKDYLQRNNMTQKQFVIGLIENEIERDLTQRADISEAPADIKEANESRTETAAVSDCESASEEVEEQSDEQESADFADDFDDESEESENPDEDEDLDESEDQDESEEMGMSMGM